MEKIKQKIFQSAKKIVIKIGTHVLTNESGTLDYSRIEKIVAQIHTLSAQYHKKIILVSSGAIGAGMGKLGISRKPKSLPDIQALAAVGQGILIEAYRKEFNRYKMEIGQILVTKEDFQNRSRYINISNTLSALMKKNIVPVFNENDTVSTAEITFGDNDQLCALISHSMHADLVIIFSNMNGFLDYENQSQVIPVIAKIDQKILSKISNTKSTRGAGGMTSKIMAIRQLVQSGEPVILVNGKNDNILLDLIEGKETGTLFTPNKGKLKRKKRWIAFSAKPSGVIRIDKGAKSAILKNSSLLAIGIKNIEDGFEKGDIVRILYQEEEIARGLVNYSSKVLNQIKGLKSKDFPKTINNGIYEEVIHKDNLVITQEV